MQVTQPTPASESQPVESSSFPALAWALIGLTAVWCVLWFLHAQGYWEDDAYIHLEFARSLAEHRGFAFNGHIVYGDTSPLWVWLLVAFHAVIPGWIAAGKTLAAVGCVFALVGAFFFARSLVVSLPREASFTFGAAMVLLFVTNPYFGYWAFSGMEALTAAGLVCWACVAIAPPRPSPARFLIAALLGGIAPLLRPEMGFFTVLLGLVLLQRLLTTPASVGRRVALFVSGLVLLAGPGVAWGIYALRTFGRVLPNTNAAKRAAPGDSVLHRLLNLYGFGFPLVLLGIAALVIWLLLHWPGPEAEEDQDRPPARPPHIGSYLHAGAWLLFVWTIAAWIFYMADHTYVQTRYIFVSAPVLTIAILAFWRKISPNIYRAGVAFGLLFGLAVSFLATWPLIDNKVQVDQDYADLAAFIHTLPPDAPVAHYSIGEAAFLSQHPILDTGGIIRPDVIPYLWDPTPERLLAWVHRSGAQYAIVDHQPEPGAKLLWSRDIPTTGWFLDPRRYDATERLQLWQLAPPSGTAATSSSPSKGHGRLRHRAPASSGSQRL
jgi:hypothetical protein